MIRIDTIQDHIDGGYKVTAHCPNNHNVDLDLEDLAKRLGADFNLSHDSLVPRLRCSRCGEKALGIILHAPMSSYGNPALRR